MISEKGPAGGEPPTNTRAHRWVMRSSNGSEWETTFYYTSEQVDKWECSKPVRPIGGVQ